MLIHAVQVEEQGVTTTHLLREWGGGGVGGGGSKNTVLRSTFLYLSCHVVQGAEGGWNKIHEIETL